MLALALGVLLLPGAGWKGSGVGPAPGPDPAVRGGLDPSSVDAPAGPGPAALGPSADPGPAGGPSGSSAPENLTLTGGSVLNLSHSISVANLTVEGSAELIFGNSSWSATLSIYGNVYLSGHGRLLLWDTYVDVVGTYTGERTVFVNDSARLTLNEALVSSDNVGWNGELYGDANFTLLSSALNWHSVLQFHDNATFYADNSKVEADVQPADSTTITQIGCGGGALWFPFYGGVNGTFSFPAPNEETNWSFPPSGATGLHYRVRLHEDWPALYAVTLYDGSNVTVENTSELDTTFLPVDGTVTGAGLRFGLNANYTFASGPFRLHLLNVTVDSWSFYPVDSDLTLNDSQLGEVMGWEGSRMLLQDSNLTDLGGYYAVYENSSLTVSDCTVGSTVMGNDDGTVLLENSTVLPGETVLAVNSATIAAFNVTLGAGAEYEAQQQGEIAVHEPLTVAATLDGRPAPGANVTVRPADGEGPALAQPTNGAGVAQFYPEVLLVNASGNRSSGALTLTALARDAAAAANLSVEGPTVWNATLAPLVSATVPSDGAQQVAVATNLTFSFLFPMNRSATVGALELDPDLAAQAFWSLDSRTLTVVPQPAWPAGSLIEAILGEGARTADGIGFDAPYEINFTTAPAVVRTPAPEVVGSTPGAGATEVGLSATVVVTFSEAMEAEATASAFSVAPAVPGGRTTVNGTTLLWTAAAPFSPSTTYTIDVATNATALDGATLGQAWSAAFSTLPSDEVPTLVASDPANGTTLATVPGDVVLTWNLAMDPTSTIAAFAVAPFWPGTVTVRGPNLTWTPSTPLARNTTYTLSVNLGAESLAGVPLVAREWMSFHVAAGPAPGGTTVPRPSTGPSPWPEPWAIALVLVAAGGMFAAGYFVRGRRPPPPTAE